MWYQYRITSRSKDGQLANNYRYQDFDSREDAVAHKKDIKESIEKVSKGFVCVEKIHITECPNYPDNLF